MWTFGPVVDDQPVVSSSLEVDGQKGCPLMELMVEGSPTPHPIAGHLGWLALLSLIHQWSEEGT